MKLHEIKEKRAALVTEMRAILAAAGSNALTADAQAKFDGLKAQVTDLEGQEARAQFLEDAERRMMGDTGSEHRDRASLEGNVSVLRVLQAQMEGRALSGAEAEYSQEAERRSGRKASGIYVPMSAFEQRVSTASGAADIVGTDHRADQYIGPMRNNLLARKLGVRVLSGLTGNVSIPKHQTSMTTGWVADNSALSASDMAFDPVTLSPKHAGGLTEMSRQLLQQSAPSIEQLVKDDLGAMLAQAIDSAILIGGGSNEPDGIIATSGVQTANLATLSWANVLAMLQKLDIVNADAVNFVGSTKVKAKLMGTLKASGIAGYLMEGGKMADLPCYFSNQLAEKTGTPNTGRLIAGDFSQVLLGIWSEVDLLVNPYSETAYTKGNVLVRAMSTVDVALRHPDAFVFAEDITI
ncbi:phage major capsid protein [Propionivibrio sp.]|uniref:phage major capsid protein n=1 Tax=Propionivibrio sp. TaxID=2212460 RepID=UPI00272E0906|nr:phage major capsid protein [Propionivibrio sp.]